MTNVQAIVNHVNQPIKLKDNSCTLLTLEANKTSLIALFRATNTEQ